MKKVIQVCLAVFASVMLGMPAWANPSVTRVSNMAAEMLNDLKLSGVELEVMSVQYAKQDPWIQDLLRQSPSEFEAGTMVTALYYQGTCTVLVNTRAVEHESGARVSNDISKDDLLFFVTAHTVSHCVSQHRHPQGPKTAPTPPALLSNVLKHKEEAFADILASLYVRTKKDNAGAILSNVLGSRIETADSSDALQSTAIYVTAAMKYEGELSFNNLVDISNAIRR